MVSRHEVCVHRPGRWNARLENRKFVDPALDEYGGESAQFKADNGGGEEKKPTAE